MIISAPLPRLESLAVEPHVSPKFYSTLFSRDWPALKRLYLRSYIKDEILLLIASQNWIKQLEHVYLWFEDCIGFATADGLHTFLKGSENGVLEKLELPSLPPLFLTAFQGIKLERLKYIVIVDIKTWEDIAEGNLDVSAFINVLFDSCEFPNLEVICMDYCCYINNLGEEGKVRWVTPPRFDSNKLIASFPKLKTIRLDSIDLSPKVAHYLGNFRNQTGCQLACERPFGHSEPSTRKYELLLDKLDLKFGEWYDFCIQRDFEAYKDFVYWNAMSMGRFNRIAFAILLVKATDVTKLASFISLVEAEEEGTVMAAEDLEMLKAFLNRRLFDESRFWVCENFTWNKIENLIDFKEELPLGVERCL